MNIFNNMWNDIWTRYEARHEPEQLRPLAEMYWRGLLMLSVACVVGALALGVWQFVTVIESISSVQSGVGVSSPSVLDRNKLESVLRLYDSRSVTFTELKTNPVSVPDPSK